MPAPLPPLTQQPCSRLHFSRTRRKTRVNNEQQRPCTPSRARSNAQRSYLAPLDNSVLPALRFLLIPESRIFRSNRPRTGRDAAAPRPLELCPRRLTLPSHSLSCTFLAWSLGHHIFFLFIYTNLFSKYTIFNRNIHFVY